MMKPLVHPAARLRVIALFSVFSVFAVASLFSVAAQEPRPKRPGVSTPGVKIPIERLKPDAVFSLPGVPDWLAIDESVWVSNSPKHTVHRLDVKANTVIGTFEVGKHPCSGLTAAFGSLWVPLCGEKDGSGKGLARVSLKDGKLEATLPFEVPQSEGGIASGAGSVWVITDAKGTLTRIDPATNKAVAEITVAPGSYTVAFADNTVWVTSTEKSVLTRINARTNVVEETIPVGPRPRFLVVGEGAVWTVNQGDGTISRVDIKTNKVVATIEAGIPGPGGEIAVGEGSVWVTSFEFPITRIDAATNKVVQQFYGDGGDAIRFGHGSVWLSNLRAANVWRLDPKRIVATLPE
jgi:virginiamycin B lyase